MPKQKPQLIIALDVDTLGQVRELIDALSPVVEIFKVGSQLFTSCGPTAVRFIQARGKKVFLDLKYHDIPNTVASAVRAAVTLNVAVDRTRTYDSQKDPHAPGVIGFERRTEKAEALFMYTLHTLGGVEMMRIAVEAGRKAAEEIGAPKPLAVGVTVLTSQESKADTRGQVLERALMAKQAALDGVVASCQEAAFLRKEFGGDFVIVTPGIRPSGADVQDQKRVATPAEAVKNGSDFLVVGRPVVEAADPLKAAKKILEEMNSVS